MVFKGLRSSSLVREVPDAAVDAAAVDIAAQVAADNKSAESLVLKSSSIESMPNEYMVVAPVINDGLKSEKSESQSSIKCKSGPFRGRGPFKKQLNPAFNDDKKCSDSKIRSMSEPEVANNIQLIEMSDELSSEQIQMLQSQKSIEQNHVFATSEELHKDEEVYAVRASIDHVGQKIESSKVRFTWVFRLSNVEHRIEFYHSKLSGRKKIYFDSILIYSQQQLRTTGFQYSWPCSGHLLSVILDPLTQTFSLFINGIDFRHFYSKPTTVNRHLLSEILHMDPITHTKGSAGTQENIDLMDLGSNIMGQRLSSNESKIYNPVCESNSNPLSCIDLLQELPAGNKNVPAPLIEALNTESNFQQAVRTPDFLPMEMPDLSELNHADNFVWIGEPLKNESVSPNMTAFSTNTGMMPNISNATSFSSVNGLTSPMMHTDHYAEALHLNRYANQKGGKASSDTLFADLMDLASDKLDISLNLKHEQNKSAI